MSAHRLDFGGLDLVNADGTFSAEGFWFETLADGFNLGSPEAVKVLVASLMRDGDDSRISRYGNRSVTLTVQVCGPDLAAIAAGETALSMVVAGGRTELSWTPPDGYGKTTVFTVLNSVAVPQPDDLAEVRPGVKRRTYALTLECKPFGRSVNPETVVFSTAQATPTVVDACSSTANWSLTEGDAMTATTFAGDTALQVTSASHSFKVQFNGTAPSANFVAVDVNAALTASVSLATAAGSVQPLMKQPLGTGYTRYWFARSTIAPPVRIYVTDFSNSVIYIGGLLSSTTLPGVLSANVSGSVRTEGSITVYRAGTTSAFKLQWVQVYADPMLATGFQPATVASWQYGWEGTYVAYVSSASGGVAGDTVAVTLDGQTVSSKLDALTAALPFRPIGEFQLGGYKSGNARADGVVTAPTITVNGSATSTPTVRLFRKHPDASLTYLQPGLVNTVDIVTPSLDLPRGGFYGDTASLVSYATAPSPEFPLILPGDATLLWVDGFNVSTNAATVTLTHYPQWLMFAVT